MAIPSNYIDKITNKDTGESRPISPASDMVRVDNENFEGSSLDEVLDEVAEALEHSGQGDGTVTAVKMNNGTPIEPDDDGVVDLGTVITQHQDISGKADKSEMSVVPGTGSNADKAIITLKQGTSAPVLTQHQDVSQLATKSEVYDKTTADGRYVQKETGKGLSTNDYTNADKTKLAGISAGAEVNVIDGIIVGNTEVQPVNKKVTIPAGADGITPHIGSNGHWWLGDENDSENDTGITAQGPAGTSYTSADLAIGNALNGQGDVLGMQGAMQMKANIDSLFTSLSRLYSKLGNMAFWDATDKAAAAPTALDWQVPQVTVTLDKTALSANAMITNSIDQEISGTSVSVDQGSGLTLKIKPRPDYTITAASATIGGVSQTLTEDNGVYTLVLDSVTSAITIVLSVSAAATILITYGTPSHCSVPSGVTNPAGVLSGGTANIQYECESGYVLTANNITISGATVGTITNVGNVYTIPITHDGTSQSISITASASKPSIRLLRGYYIGSDSKQLTNAPIGVNNTVSVDQVVETDYILLPQGSSMQTMKITWGLTRSQEKDATQGPPASVAFFTKENGEFKLIAIWSWSGITTTFRTINATSFNSSAKSAELNAALQAGNLYFRSALCLTEANGDTLVSGAGIQWNSVDIFTSADSYSVVTDPSLFDSFTMQTS